ncbi:tigger transposable element-derived protein 1-like [Lacerta agilis]|uniref:tigger transposable element-derived protein 1-like n=1 Tax=Lacerta agilis TaxID=80427 RepID=UPI001419F3D9|nr:tigger transposable element-derived protein 1-like [Lacerta agilis]
MDKSCKGKRTIKRATIEVKKQIISKHESGVRVSDLATQFGMAKSTICTILKNKEAIKGANVAKGVKTLTRQRTQTIEEVEKLLLIWIKEKQLAGDSISESIICEKALHLHAELIRNTPGTSAEGEIFKASRGWFDNFKRRSGIHSVVRHGEAASANKLVADRFVLDFKDYVESQGFIPQQVFNCDETGLFRKKMPKRTYITKEEKSLQVNSDDVEELVEDHKTELTTEELQNIPTEQQQAATEEISLEESREIVSTALIKEMCAKWAEVQSFVEKYHPDKAAVSHATNTFNDNAISHFRQILKHRQKQISTGKKLVRKRISGSEPGVSGVKKAREGTAGEESLTAIMEEDPDPSSKQ